MDCCGVVDGMEYWMVVWSSVWLCGVANGCVEEWMVVSSIGWLCRVVDGFVV